MEELPDYTMNEFSIDVSDLPEGVDAESIMRQVQQTGIMPINRTRPASVVERMIPLQDELNELHYKNQIALHRESYKGNNLVEEQEEVEFLGNVE